MRYVSIQKAEPGMRLANDLFDATGRTLIGENGMLTANYIERLKEYGFDGVYIKDQISEGIEISNAISPKLRSEGMLCIKDQNIDRCREIALEIVKELLSKGTIPLDMMDLRSYDDYTYAHSVNVAVLCGVIGMGLSMREKDLSNIVLAGLLHDLGKMTIPSEILNKPGRLTQEEYAVVKTHAARSYELLSDRWDISAHVKVAVLYHHENIDGSGYPEGIEGAAQSQLTKIIHVADVYDALVSKRPYKNPYSPQEAAEYLMGGCGILFDQDAVTTLLHCVPLYPKGTEVVLSDGRKGIVFDNVGTHNLRPIVKLYDGAMLNLLDKDNLNLTLHNVFDDELKLQRTEDFEQQRKAMIREQKEYRILVVDDVVTSLQMLEGILEDQYEVPLAKTGKEALQYLEKNRQVDLVLMDINMPEMDGIETAERIQAMTGNKIPIIFVTSICEKDTVNKCKQLGAAGYITKPYETAYIREQIRKVIENWSNTH